MKLKRVGYNHWVIAEWPRKIKNSLTDDYEFSRRVFTNPLSVLDMCQFATDTCSLHYRIGKTRNETT